MTLDEFRQALGCLIADSKPLPIREILEAIDDEREALRGELIRAKLAETREETK